MNSHSAEDNKGFLDQVNSNSQDIWANLSEKEQSILKKIWSILTYKWQWQIIFNAPFLVIWILDKTMPAVHSFDMRIISSLPIPMIIKTYLGFS